MSHAVYMELFALGSCLPGPTSTQVSFAIGTVRKGVLGASLVSSLALHAAAHSTPLRAPGLDSQRRVLLNAVGRRRVQVAC